MQESPAAVSAAVPVAAATPRRLEAAALSCVRNETTLFRDLEFSVASGDVLLVGGPNGSGKTSLLRLLCGLGTPDSGTVRWCGSDIAALGAEFRSALQYVGHGNGVKLDLTAAENLEFSARLRGARDAAAIAASLEAAGLNGCADLRARLLSAGQRRRLALARLALVDAPLWLLDEPLTALDARGRDFVGGLLAEHARGGGMAVVATHESPVPRSVAARRIDL